MAAKYDGAEPPIELRHRLQIAREWAGYEQTQLAEEMGVSRNTISNYEHGRTTPRKLILNAWARACGVSMDWLRGQPTGMYRDLVA